MVNPPSGGPLSDEELNELDRLLLDLEELDDSMDIAMLDGFFAALVSGRRTILPSEWMRWVWDIERGKASPTLESQADAQRLLALMMRHMNDMAATLVEDPASYQPVLMESPNKDVDTKPPAD